MNDHVEINSKTVLEFLKHISKKNADKTAFIIEREEVEQVSYKEFAQYVMHNAVLLHNTYGENQCIAIVGENSIEWITTYFSILCSGNIAVPLEPDGSVDHTVDNLKRCECKVIMHDCSQSNFASHIAKEFADNLTLKQFETFSKVNSGEWEQRIPSLEETKIATIIFTSGTTGRSKGVKLSHCNIVSDVLYSCEALPLSGRTITILPFHHMYAITTSIFMSLYYGTEIVICPSAKKAFKYTSVYHPTYLFAVPMILSGLCKKISMDLMMNKSDDYSRVIQKILGDKFVFFVSGGAILSKDLQEQLERYKLSVYNGYGITECSPVVSVNRRDGSVLNSTVGTALPNVEVCIMNADENGEGEICVKGDIVMSGYLNDAEATKEAFYDEWFRTGDIGRLDELHRIHITGRCKNLIILSNGKNVSPEEIEEKLQCDSMVQEIIVYEKNDCIMAVIYPNESEELIDYQVYFNDLINHYNSKVPLHKKISKVQVVHEPLARTSTGKIKRNNFHD